MNNKSQCQILTTLFAFFLVLVVAASCGKETPQEVDTPKEQEIEESNQTKEAPMENIKLDDVLYPDAEFLFEIPGIGGPMLPCRFYVARDATTDQAAQFYTEKLPWFEVNIDEPVDGYRHLQLDYSEHILDELNAGENPEDIMQKGKELEGRLAGVEVVHSSFTGGLSNLDLAIKGYDRENDIPANSTIIVLVYFKNPY